MVREQYTANLLLKAFDCFMQIVGNRNAFAIIFRSTKVFNLFIRRVHILSIPFRIIKIFRIFNRYCRSENAHFMRRSIDIFSTPKVTPSLEIFLSRRPIDTSAIIICYYIILLRIMFFCKETFILTNRDGRKSSMNHVGQVRVGFLPWRIPNFLKHLNILI